MPLLNEPLSRAIDALLADEGGYVNNPKDSGGETKFGITKATAARHGFNNVKSLTRDNAVEIYYKDYFVATDIHLLADIDETIGAECFNAAVLAGPTRGISFLQRACNALLSEKDLTRHFLLIDGTIGPATLGAVNVLLSQGRRDNILKLQNFYECDNFIKLVYSSPSQREFINGWVAKRFKLA